MATVEVLAPSGYALTLRLYPLDSDTEATNQAMTEATNRKGTYTATVTGQSGNFSATVDAAGSLIGNGYLWLQDDSGTYGTVDERSKLAIGERSQESPPESLTAVDKIGYLYKFAINRAVNDGSVVTLYNFADVTVDQKANVSDAAGVVTRAKMITGP